MDCLEDKFRLYCPDHFYWYNQRVHGIGKLLDQKGKLSNKTTMLLKSVVSAKNYLTGPGSCPAPGVDGLLYLHVVLLVLLLLLLLLQLLLGLPPVDYLALEDSLLLLARLWWSS